MQQLMSLNCVNKLQFDIERNSVGRGWPNFSKQHSEFSGLVKPHLQICLDLPR